MTTSTASSTSASSVTAVRATEVTRLEAVVATGKGALAAAQAVAATAATALGEVTTRAATLQQQASVLQQGLAAATTGPERHAVELALNANRAAQMQADLDRLAATGKKAVADLAVTRTQAANQTADGDLQRARQDLTTATADEGTDTALLAALKTDYAAAVGQAAAQAAAEAEAETRLGVLLGGKAMVDRVSGAITAARGFEDGLGATAATADASVRAAATRLTPVDGEVATATAVLQTARAAATAAVQDAPARVDAAAAIVDAVRAEPPSPQQPAIDAAAAAVVPGDSGAYQAWLVTLPDALIDTAVGLLDAVHDLTTIAAGDPNALVKSLTDADDRLGKALSAQLSARSDLAAATAAADVARGALDAVPGTAAARAERHRAAFLRGE